MSIKRLPMSLSISGVFYEPIRFEELPIPDSGSTSLTLNGDELVGLIGIKGKGIFFRCDGGVPAADAGHYFGAGSFMTLGVQSLQGFRAVGCATEAGSARLTISYEK